MSRIRSIHPGLFTDPEFVQLSMTARMALIGLWTEADDHGVFEWKPLALKMKVFPGDAVDMQALMVELVSADRIHQVEVEGKPYGICRNFMKYQRPKNPSYRCPFSPSWGEFLGTKSSDVDTATPAVPQGSTSTPENPPQMEDGGDRREKKDSPPAAQPDQIEADFEAWYAIYPLHKARGAAIKGYRAARRAGAAQADLIAAAQRYRDDPARKPEFTKHPATWLNGRCWLDDGNVSHETTEEEREENLWFGRLTWAASSGRWNPQWAQVEHIPKHIQEKFPDLIARLPKPKEAA